MPDDAKLGAPRAKERRWRTWIVVFVLVALATAILGLVMIRMPGKSYAGPLGEPTVYEQTLARELERDVRKLAGEIGDRNTQNPAKLEEAARWIEGELASAGLAPRRESFDVLGTPCANVWTEIPGSARASEIVILGAHYDSVAGCPGANDNATGVAGLLALARHFAKAHPSRTLRFVAFTNEEPPWFHSQAMGSLVHARGCRQRNEDVVAMISLETMGYFSDADGSQRYPLSMLGWFYPTRGNFITFVGNYGSRELVRSAVATFRRSQAFPSEGAALPDFIPGVAWSDQWAFWNEGYRALMVTDTAPFRYPYYHTAEDTPDKVDFARLARVVEGLHAVVAELVDGENVSR